MTAVHIPSHGLINGVVYQASGARPRPTIVICHGLSGNEKNLDLARRRGARVGTRQRSTTGVRGQSRQLPLCSNPEDEAWHPPGIRHLFDQIHSLQGLAEKNKRSGMKTYRSDAQLTFANPVHFSESGEALKSAPSAETGGEANYP
jgi:hypothetical protein